MALIVSGIIFYFHIQTVLTGPETSEEIFGLTDISPGFSYSEVGMLFYVLEMAVLAKRYLKKKVAVVLTLKLTSSHRFSPF